MAVAFTVLLFACLFQGSFGICFKKYQPFSWEAFWLLFSIIGVLCIPHIWCSIEVPHYMSYIKQTPSITLFWGALAGFFWGISSIWYSKAIDYIGVSLTTGINLGLSNLLGSFIPMIILNTYPKARVLVVLLIGQAVLMVGVAVLSKAGFIKNKTNNTEEKKESKAGKLFGTGLIMALASGAGSAAINIGASASNYPVNLAINNGVNSTSASLLAWVVVFAGGFIANFVYALIKVLKNKTYTDYVKPGCGKAYFKVVLTSFVWFAALAIYGKATALLGTLGPVVGWVVFNGLALIIANIWGFLDKEWKGYKKAKNVAIFGNVIILIALVIVGVSNGL
ncbi:MAG: rhamnose/proton symporter RhaT [Clostridia bacterium]|jgi:L-rhamnose-H+ transport protein|nr:rhamnose/proton symporter RhaT [Clostridia bacterium]MCI1999778.1 rhamnose/proton symporter RhaT [Clostridia bacterium]MCI2014306.1 rhamnose/proton symporter RhaT [Clostridia bacterium]